MEVAAQATSSRTPGLNWSQGGACALKDFDNNGPCWTLRTGTESNKTLTWASLPHYFVSVVFWQGLHCPYYFVSLCLNYVSVLTGGVTANGFKWRIQGDGKAKLCACICQWWPYHYFCLFTPSTVILWLCFDRQCYVYGLCVHTPAYTCNLTAAWWAHFRISWTLNFELANKLDPVIFFSLCHDYKAWQCRAQ